jgi:hypothetical protein
MANYFEELEHRLDTLERELLQKGLPASCQATDLETLICSLEALLETANDLFDKVG